MQLQQSPWTDDRIAELRKFFDRGWSCSQIGREINVTRNAVIGKLHRLGLSRPQKVAEKKARIPRISKYGFYSPRPKQKAILQRVYEAVERSPKNKTLLELEKGECKWPLGHEAPYLFCAHEAADGLPYCAFHWRLGHTHSSGDRKLAGYILAKQHAASTMLSASMDREDGAAA